jgi:hypothetical protein
MMQQYLDIACRWQDVYSHEATTTTGRPMRRHTGGCMVLQRGTTAGG